MCVKNPAFIRETDEHKQPIKIAFIRTQRKALYSQKEIPLMPSCIHMNALHSLSLTLSLS